MLSCLLHYSLQLLSINRSHIYIHDQSNILYEGLCLFLVRFKAVEGVEVFSWTLTSIYLRVVFHSNADLLHAITEHLGFVSKFVSSLHRQQL